MKTIHLETVIGGDGVLRIETPTEYRNIAAELVLVVHPIHSGASEAYPLDFFDRLDSIHADDLQERPEQGIVETRESLD